MRRIALTTLVLAVALALAIPASAIIGGVPDGDDHPNVAMIVMVDKVTIGKGRHAETFYESWRCSGTVVSSSVVLTAGHCVYSDYPGAVEHAFVRFDSEFPFDDTWYSDRFDLTDADGTVIGFDIEGWLRYLKDKGEGWLEGRPVPHPEYADFAGFPNTHDVGIVTFRGSPLKRIAPASIGLIPPDLGHAKGTKDITFTSVGYGTQQIVPYPVSTWTRMRALSALGTSSNVYSSGYNLTLNGGDSNRFGAETGGTCFGDSGGPTFYQGAVVAVTSYGIAEHCNGSGYSYILGQRDVLDWLNEFSVPVPRLP